MIMVSDDRRRVETELLDSIVAYLDRFDEFKATSHGGSFEESETRRVARKKAADADELMRERMASYRQFVKAASAATEVESTTSGAGVAKDRLPDLVLKI
jgi:hypothetical protein